MSAPSRYEYWQNIFPAVKEWFTDAHIYKDRRAITSFFLGVSAGLPMLLIFSTLSLWLGEANVQRKTITMFGWAALGYSFKFIWAPLLDSFALPILDKKLGNRRAWMLISQCMIIYAILLMANTNPAEAGELAHMAWGAVFLGFSSATQDVSIDAYRIELAGKDNAIQSVTSAMFVAGYRVGMIIAGAGALYIAAKLGTSTEHYKYEAWCSTYYCMAACMGIGIVTTLVAEKVEKTNTQSRSAKDNLRLLLLFFFACAEFIIVFAALKKFLPVGGGAFTNFLRECFILCTAGVTAFGAGSILILLKFVPQELAVDAWMAPFYDFFRRYGKTALLLLALIGLFRISDIVAGFMSNKFYQDMGFNKIEIAAAVKTFGVIMVIIGGFSGGMFAQRYSLIKMMFIAAVLSSATNLLFTVLAYLGHNVPFLYVAVSFDNFASGLAGTVFIAFLSALTNVRFTATQYAMFSSIMTLIPKVIGGYSGAIVDAQGYSSFFMWTALMGIPILFLIYLVGKKFDIKAQTQD